MKFGAWRREHFASLDADVDLNGAVFIFNLGLGLVELLEFRLTYGLVDLPLVQLVVIL